MTHPPLTYRQSTALDNKLVSIQFSTATWMMLASILHERNPPEASRSNRRWAADHILYRLLEEHGYAEPAER